MKILWVLFPFLLIANNVSTQPISATETISATACVSTVTPCCRKAVLPGGPIENLTISTQGAATIIINSNVTLTESEMTTTQTISEEAARQQAVGARPTPAKPEEEKKPYEEIIKDATKQVGLFTVFIKKDKKEDKTYWEIRPDQFSTDFLLSAKVGHGVGMLFPGKVLESKVLQFCRMDDKVQLIEPHPRYQAAPDSPIKKGVERAYGESIIASFPISATNPASDSCVIDVQPFFLSDFSDVGKALEGYNLDKDESRIEQVKVFPENIEVYARQHFKSSGKPETKVLADPSSALVLLRFSFRSLPKSNFVPRPADDRVGHFIEAYQDLSDLESRDAFVRHITAWNIEKASPELEVSPPKEPLVFWIENTVPYQYREAAKEGVEMWNKAFRAAGYENAVVAKQMPDDADWDPEDSRYHTVHWNTMEELPFAGLGQWVANPLTGEILDCDVIIDGDIVRWLRRIRQFYEPLRGLPEHSSPDGCQYGLMLAQETQCALAVLAARGEIGNSTDTIEEFINQYVKQLVCHEVGHVLGLRHNFKASTLLPLDQLHNKDLTAEKGLSSSVMDYLPVNLAPRGATQGFYWNPSVGPYDCWAIQYAYLPLSATTQTDRAKELDKVASRARDTELAYLTDEDLWVANPERPLGLDPTNAWFDLSSDPLAWNEQQMDVMRDAWTHAATILEEGEGYYDLRSAVGMFLGYYTRYAVAVSRYIGGAYVVRSRVGEKDGRTPIIPIPASQQYHALQVLRDKVFSDEPFQFDPSMLNMMVNERWLHWGVEWGSAGRTDFPLHDYILMMRQNVLNTLFDPLVLSRIREAEQRVPAGETAFTIPDLFADLTDAVWGDVHTIALSGTPPQRTLSNTAPLLSSHRRALQREYVRRLADLMLTKRGETPEDARTHAWNALNGMKEDIDKLLANKTLAAGLDQYSLVHLKETAAGIARALDARLEIKAG